MVAESLKPGASVAMVAQRYGVNANLLFTWRRQEAAGTNGGAEPVKLVPVTVAEAEAPSVASVAAPEPIGRMEIVLPGGERIIVGVDVDATALARVVRTLTRRSSRSRRAFGCGWRRVTPICGRASMGWR